MEQDKNTDIPRFSMKELLYQLENGMLSDGAGVGLSEISRERRARREAERKQAEAAQREKDQP